MKYDFDSIVERKSTYSLKWDVKDTELPMWVADMDFKTAPEIREALAKRLEQGIFGYTDVPDAWYDAYINWWERRHGFKMEKEWLVFTTGVIPAISSSVRKLTTPNENVVIQTPVYNIFFNSVINNGCRVLENALIYEDGNYRMDFEDLEEKLKNPQTTLMILCNPQNPGGKIWDKESLKRVGELCAKYHVTVIADEIHCDLVDPGSEYTPFALVSEACKNNSITCIAPTKTFNIAGLQTAAVSIPNPVLRHKVWRALNTDEVAEPNAFAMDATIAAFTKGEPWLTALNAYIFENKKLVRDYVKEHIKEISVAKSDATYLLWLDCSKVTDHTDELQEFIRKETGLFVSEGSEYGKGGEKFLRLNVACPRVYVEDGLSRLKAGIEAYISKTR